MSLIDHYDIITGQPRSSAQLRKARWPRRLQNFVNRLEGRFAKRRSRKVLVSLDDRLLDDVGITRDQAREEARRSFLD